MGGNSSKDQPDYWEKDEDHKECQLCSVQFSVIRRRHHCRSCGAVLCAACTSRKAVIVSRGYKEPVRVCDRCKMREGGGGNTANAAGGFGSTSRSSTGATGVRRTHSMDPSLGAAASDGGVVVGIASGSRTPRAASSLAVIEADNRGGGRGAVTPRNISNTNNNLAGGPVTRGQFSSFQNTQTSNKPPVAPNSSNARNTNAAATNSSPTTNAPMPSHYRLAVLQIMTKNPQFATDSNNSNNKKEIDMKSSVGKNLLSFLTSPSFYFDRNCITHHRNCLVPTTTASTEDWTSISITKKKPGSQLGASATATKPTSLFLTSPALASTRPTSIQLLLKTSSSSSSSNNSTLLLSALRSIQVGVVHESCVSMRGAGGSRGAGGVTPRSARGTSNPSSSSPITAATASSSSPTLTSSPAWMTQAVETLATNRAPSIGVSFEGRSFVGPTKSEPAEFFKLNDNVKSVVLSITFDQSSGSVAFSLCDNTSSSDNNSDSNNKSHVLPVLAAFPCELPSGVAGKWFAAFSVDTSEIISSASDSSSTLDAQWL